MTKIDIFSGFLGAGKTTLIKKLISQAYAGEKVVLIENEFGEIGIDGGFLKDAGINITEMNSGCICCSLVGDFSKALKKVTAEYAPERIVIEPSGVGKLSDVVAAVQHAELENASINALCAVVDAGKCKMYMKNFGEFFNDQIRSASCIVMTHTDKCDEEKLSVAVSLVRTENPKAVLVTTPLEKLTGEDLLAAMENRDSLAEELAALAREHEEHEQEHCHHHHHHDDEEGEHEHCCHHHHDDEDEEHEHCHHHHHDEDEEENEHEHCCHHHHDDEDEEHEHCHHHHHDEDEENEHEHCCHHHHHDEDEEHEHHHHHHADEVFTSWGEETTKKFTTEQLNAILAALRDEKKYGTVLRAKGIVDSAEGDDGLWIHFDYTPDEPDVRRGAAGVTGRLCVIGCHLNESAIRELFGV